MKEFDELREELRFGTRLLFQDLRDPWGHIVVRLPEGDKRKGFMLKHVRVPPPPADPEAVMIFDYDGNILEGARMKPWEIPIYTHVFKTRPDVQSVIHTHPRVATALSMAGKTVFAITHQSAQFEHGVPIFPGDMINTEELGEGLAQALGRFPAILLKGHGAVSIGTNVGHAVQNTLYLEQAARQQIWAATLGTPDVLDDRFIDFHKNASPGEGGLALWYTHMYYDRTRTKPSASRPTTGQRGKKKATSTRKKRR